ncbi:hypothetical protein ABT297_31940 [Dactylosporangium sp. NPDC000555]|uniref:hypothetical protein n=1 Tax=Dactylosporangium sp. NPDC000555 TaxID=3154260 RepID=UPI00331DD1A7
MQNAKRMLALGAMTLTAGAVFGMTATAASAATTHDGHATVTQSKPKDKPKDKPKAGPWDKGGKWDNGKGSRDRTWIAGQYRNKKTCQFFAWAGAASGRFDHGVCVPGFGKGWILVAHDNGKVAHDNGKHRHR